MNNPKQVIVVNEALKLPRGKLAAQVAHASVSAFMEAGVAARKAWCGNGMPKVVLAALDEDELQALYQQAVAARVPACLIRDAGRTVVASGTLTCLGLGPASEDAINAITGKLRLV